MPPTRHDWLGLLGEFAAQLDSGRIYNRDLDQLSRALAGATASLTRRSYIRDRTARRPY